MNSKYLTFGRACVNKTKKKEKEKIHAACCKRQVLGGVNESLKGGLNVLSLHKIKNCGLKFSFDAVIV